MTKTSRCPSANLERRKLVKRTACEDPIVVQMHVKPVQYVQRERAIILSKASV